MDYNNLVANIHKKPNGYEFVSYSEVIAYKVGQFPNGGPKNMADFWNTDKYPGPRTLKDDVVGNLEFAVLRRNSSKPPFFSTVLIVLVATFS